MKCNVNKTEKLKQILYVILVCLIGVSGVIFSVLYVDLFNSGFFNDYSVLVISLAVGLVSSVTVLTIVFFKFNKEFIYKLLLPNHMRRAT